jgi:predicted nucleic acid-binding protein
MAHSNANQPDIDRWSPHSARRTDRTEIAERAVDRLLAIPTIRLVTIDHNLGTQASQIAAHYRLRGADALYVAVEAELVIPLVSWDPEQLTRAAPLIANLTPG